MPHYTRTKAKILPEEKANVDQDSDNGQEDHAVAVAQRGAKNDAKRWTPVSGTKSKASTSPAKKRPVSTTRSDDSDHASIDHEITTKKKKVLSAASEDQDALQLRRTRSQTASTGVENQSDAAEPEGRADSTKAGASKDAQSNEKGTKKKGWARQVETHRSIRLFSSKTICSARGLKRMESDSEDWDEEVHYVDEEGLNDRIKTLIELEDKENNIYGPAKLPRTGGWAQIGSRREWTWCTSASSEVPLIFCCVGWVTYQAFYSEGSPLREVTVSIRMAEGKDKGHLQKFLKRHTSDSIPEWDNVKFTRFQAKKTEADAKPFENFYDAKEPGSYGEEDARRLSVRDDLKIGDLVVIEATAIRFAASNSPKKRWGLSPDKGEKKWVARFRLMTMWKLKDSEIGSSADEDEKPGPSRRKGKGKVI